MSQAISPTKFNLAESYREEEPVASARLFTFRKGLTENPKSLAHVALYSPAEKRCRLLNAVVHKDDGEADIFSLSPSRHLLVS